MKSIKTKKTKKRRIKFYFGPKHLRFCFFILRIKHSNIFITMVDWYKRVIVCASSGMFSLSNSKRHKKAPQIAENLILYLNHYMRIYNLNSIYLIVKSPIRYFKFYFLKEFNYYAINIIAITKSLIIPHNGPRGRAIKRRGR